MAQSSSNTTFLPGRDGSTLLRVRSVDLRPLPVWVKCSSAGATPGSLRLDAGPVVLGAGRDCDLVVDEPTVSRRHAELSLVPEGVAVRDLGSKNGLFYLGRRFYGVVLPPGSRFLLGAVEFELTADIAALQRADDCSVDRYGDLVGASAAMHDVFRMLARLEGSTVSVLITGESGTGKELVARAIHEHSLVREGPLVCVNCGALGRELARSELFGHERGAFTGAIARREGAFRAAHAGTLFLDEVAELPLDVQPLLLRALESGSVAPVGGSRDEQVRVRLLAATHRDLAEEVAAGRFRQDLYYRIRVVSLELPALRAREQDIVPIAQRFAFAAGMGPLPDDFAAALREHSWPGNVRELRNAVEAFAAVGATPARSEPPATDLQSSIEHFVDAGRTYQEQKDELVQLFTRTYFRQLLSRTEGNRSEAARRSGMQRSYLVRLLAKLGLS